MSMIRRALKDPTVTHLATISADSIPVKPLRYIYQQLAKDPTTRMCADDSWVRPWPRAESWWLMRREDAELFRDNDDLARLRFRSGCTEEQAWYYPLRLRMERWGEKALVRNECPMFSNWADGHKACKVWKSLVDDCKCPTLRNQAHVASGYMHPAEFLTIEEASYSELVRSPFWFARKFSHGAVPENVSALLDLK